MSRKPKIKAKQPITFEEDEDLLDNNDQEKEIEKYIIQKNLQYLD